MLDRASLLSGAPAKPIAANELALTKIPPSGLFSIVLFLIPAKLWLLTKIPERPVLWILLFSIIAVPPTVTEFPCPPPVTVKRFIVIPVPLISTVFKAVFGPLIVAVLPYPSRVILWTSSGITTFSLQMPLTIRASPGIRSLSLPPMVSPPLQSTVNIVGTVRGIVLLQ